jgi:8-oxo-dGTP pyrophosphatase MutT (NUDIX family)
MESKQDQTVFYKQSGVIPHIIKNEVSHFVLITSKKGEWIFPKGNVEKYMSSWDSAAKEGLEEAGLEGKISPQLCGQYEYQKWEGTCKVKMHLMNVNLMHEHWDEKDFRKRKIVTLDEALEIIQDAQLPILLAAADILGLVKIQKIQDVA